MVVVSKKGKAMLKLIRFILGINPPCQHNWVVLDKTTVPSRYDIMTNHSREVRAMTFTLDMEKLCYQETMVILSCSKCGKIEAKRTSNSF
jgi:hypothetical protein